MIFTGLTPEHIESHGSFENYKNTKLRIFRDLEKRKNKKIHLANEGKDCNPCLQGGEIPQIIIAHGESEHAKDFLNFNVNEKITFQISSIKLQASSFQVSDLNTDSKGIRFKIDNTRFSSSLLGKFNILNSLAVISVGLSQNIKLEKIKQALEKITNVPGRMEVVHDKEFKVIVDYAYEPNSMENVYKEVKSWNPCRIITVFGGTGGGRDKWRRPKIGELAAKYADIIILTTDDPYQDDPEEIINEIKVGIKKNDKWQMINDKLHEVLDRKEAIKKAISLASKNDIVLILGKGCEQKIALKDGYKDWDDREVVKEVLACSQTCHL